jgi:hypothetical protein
LRGKASDKKTAWRLTPAIFMQGSNALTSPPRNARPVPNNAKCPGSGTTVPEVWFARIANERLG